jgi:hypothetical protein
LAVILGHFNSLAIDTHASCFASFSFNSENKLLFDGVFAGDLLDEAGLRVRVDKEIFNSFIHTLTYIKKADKNDRLLTEASLVQVKLMNCYQMIEAPDLDEVAVVVVVVRHVFRMHLELDLQELVVSVEDSDLADDFYKKIN